MTEHNSDQLDQLASDFWQWRAFHQPASSDDIPRIERPRDWEPDWSPAGVERQCAALAAFKVKSHSDKLDRSRIMANSTSQGAVC